MSEVSKPHSSLEHVRWILHEAVESGRWHLSGRDLLEIERLLEQYEVALEACRQYREEKDALQEQLEALRSAAEAVMGEWSKEFAEFGSPEDGDIPKWQSYPYSKLRDALASYPAKERS